MHENTFTTVIISIKNNFLSVFVSCVLLNSYFLTLCCAAVEQMLFLHFIYVSILFSVYRICFLIFLFLMRKNLQKSFFSFNKENKFWEELKKKKVGSKWAFKVCLERKLGSGWLKENKFYISKHQAHLSFYLLYVLIYSDTWSIYGRKWLVGPMYQLPQGNELSCYQKFQTVEWLCGNKGQFIHSV